MGVKIRDWLFTGFHSSLDLEISKYGNLMNRNIRFVRIRSKRCKQHAFGNHKVERCKGYNHIPHG